MTPTTTMQLEEVAITTQATKRSYYPGLDGLRGVAILVVFFSHYNGGHTAGGKGVHMLAVLTDAGWVGVDLFFVLSGFLITGILLDTADSEHRARNFYARRALRIFPVFYAILFAFLLLTPVLHLHWQWGHLLYFFYLSNMLAVLAPHLTPPGIGVDLVHLWSLAVEEQFYLLWPMVVWFVRDRRNLLRISLAIMAGSLILRVVLAIHGVDTSIIYQLLATRADSLISGGVLALLLRDQPASALPTKAIALVSGLSIVGIFLATRSTLHNTPLMSTIGYSMLALFFCCIVFYAQQPKSIIRRAVDRSWLRFFGKYSYGLYLYHGVLLVFLYRLLPVLQRVLHSTVAGGIAFLLLSLGTCLSVAMLSFHFFEAPILKLKRRFA